MWSLFCLEIPAKRVFCMGLEVINSFAQNPLTCTGTLWKKHRFQEAWNSVIDSGAWLRQVAPRLQVPVNRKMEHISVVADEPDHMIDEMTLMMGKVWNQGLSLVLAMTEIDVLHGAVVPDWVKDMFSTGKARIVFTSGDVGVREINLNQDRSIYIPRRNYYIPAGLHSIKKRDKLRTHLDQFWQERYGMYGQNDSALRVLDTSLSISTLDFTLGNLPDMNITPGVSTVGVFMSRHPLATREGRHDFMDQVENLNAGDPKVVERGWSPLTVLGGRAGGVQTEVLAQHCIDLGVDTQILATGKTMSEKLVDLGQHGEGVPVRLFKDLILTAASRTPNEKQLHLFPPGLKMKQALSI